MGHPEFRELAILSATPLAKRWKHGWLMFFITQRSSKMMYEYISSELDMKK